MPHQFCKITLWRACNIRIVITRDSSALAPDGVNTFIFELSEALLRKGVDVQVLSGYGQDGFSTNSFIVRYMFDVAAIPSMHCLSRSVFASAHKTVISWLTLGTRYLMKLRPDIVILNGAVPIWPRVPKITVCHGLRTVDGRYPMSGRLYNHVMYRVTNRLVAVSEPLKREIMNELGLMNVAVIPNGVNTARYVPLPRSQRESVILHMGTRPVKNLKTTVKAFDIVLKELPDVQLYITGKASIRDVMSSSVKSTKNVKFLDVMPKRELRQLLSKVVVVSAPSLYEAFSFSTLEAFASGTPVVGSSAIPAGLLINGYNGYRISHPTDYLELANRLLDLLRDNSRWNAMSQNARATAMKYDSSKMADMYLEMSKGLR